MLCRQIRICQRNAAIVLWNILIYRGNRTRIWRSCISTAGIFLACILLAIYLISSGKHSLEKQTSLELQNKRRHFINTLDKNWKGADNKQPMPIRTLVKANGAFYAQNSSSNSPAKVVIIYTTKRSGSTLLGEFFNQNRECFYLFEPLFPYTRTCDVLLRERGEFLNKLAECDFISTPNEYEKIFAITKHTDARSKCLRHNMCFSNRNMNVLYRYATVCKNQEKKIEFEKTSRFIPQSPCGYPLNVTILSSLCSAATLVAYKVIRMCSMQNLEPVFANPALRGGLVSVVHLVRDPRAVLSSRLQLDNDELTLETLEEGARQLCHEMGQDLNYSETVWREGQNSTSVYGAGYLRMRYEDITLNPLESAYSIYRFLRQELPTPVKLWIHNSFLEDKKKHKASLDPYSTVKHSQQTLNAWRKKLALQDILLIQKHCDGVMKLLGYKTILTNDELTNWNLTLW